MIDCEHQWNWDKGIRFCLKCRQVRTFPTDGETGKIVWQGSDDDRSPIELPTEDKAILAKLAQALGVKKASDCINISMKLLRAWVGAYCGDHTKPHQAKQDKAQSVAQSETHNASYDTQQSLKSPLSTKVLESDLPPFPNFNDNWESPVQLEWLATFLELAKLKILKSD